MRSEAGTLRWAPALPVKHLDIFSWLTVLNTVCQLLFVFLWAAPNQRNTTFIMPEQISDWWWQCMRAAGRVWACKTAGESAVHSEKDVETWTTMHLWRVLIVFLLKISESLIPSVHWRTLALFTTPMLTCKTVLEDSALSFQNKSCLIFDRLLKMEQARSTHGRQLLTGDFKRHLSAAKYFWPNHQCSYSLQPYHTHSWQRRVVPHSPPARVGRWEGVMELHGEE